MIVKKEKKPGDGTFVDAGATARALRELAEANGWSYKRTARKVDMLERHLLAIVEGRKTRVRFCLQERILRIAPELMQEEVKRREKAEYDALEFPAVTAKTHQQRLAFWRDVGLRMRDESRT